MTPTAKSPIVALIMLCAASPALADSCTNAIARTQAQLDVAIESKADSHGWQRESLNALRNHQPTPRSLAEAEGGTDFTDALDALDRARVADRTGDIGACDREVGHARDVLK